MTTYNTPHRRFNPLTREWVLVSPQRENRPWLGQTEKIIAEDLPLYDPSCYLCPGNNRVGGIKNPNYEHTLVFDNDFSALAPEPIKSEPEASSLLVSKPEHGICRVICFSPRHDLTLPELSIDEIENVVNTWSSECDQLFTRSDIAYAQIFENKGAMMGCSNPHPHSQIWAQSQIPNEPLKELLSQRDYFDKHKRPMLLDYIAEEHKNSDRIVAINEHFAALVPFWAIWPFEILVISQTAVPLLSDLNSAQRRALAAILQQVTIRYDNLFETSFPYSMGFHQAPNDHEPHPEWVLHAHFYPPLLRSATVRKFMVGYEFLGMPQRDITPEVAAKRLRALPEVHYKHQAY